MVTYFFCFRPGQPRTNSPGTGGSLAGSRGTQHTVETNSTLCSAQTRPQSKLLTTPLRRRDGGSFSNI